MFRGINAVNLDIKGRMAVPAKYRAHLTVAQREEELIVTIDTEQKCLLLYPILEWEEIEKKIAALPSFHAATRRIQRLLIGHATELALDGHGRILLPQLLRDYAEIEKKAILLGQGNKFEIWSDILWESSRDQWLLESTLQTDDLPEEIKSLTL